MKLFFRLMIGTGTVVCVRAVQRRVIDLLVFDLRHGAFATQYCVELKRSNDAAGLANRVRLAKMSLLEIKRRTRTSSANANEKIWNYDLRDNESRREYGWAEGRLSNKMADQSSTVKHKHIDGVVPYAMVGGECGERFRSDEGDDAVTGTVLPTVASSGISSSYSSIILW